MDTIDSGRLYPCRAMVLRVLSLQKKTMHLNMTWKFETPVDVWTFPAAVSVSLIVAWLFARRVQVPCHLPSFLLHRCRANVQKPFVSLLLFSLQTNRQKTIS